MTDEKGRSQTGPKQAEPGKGIRVTKELLLPFPITATFFGIGLLSLFAIPIVLWGIYPRLIAGAYLHHHMLFAVHMLALGWGTAVALGAWQQLSVVALQVSGIPRNGPARVSVVLFAIGLVTILAAFVMGNNLSISIGGTLLIGSFVAVIMTSFQAKALAERGSVMSRFVPGALFSLLGVGVVGVLLGINRDTGFLYVHHATAFVAHLYLGPIGWFGMLIPGVSYELAPFFGMTRSDDGAGRGNFPGVVFSLIAAGIIIGLVAAIPGWRHPLITVPISVAYIVFVWDLRGIYKKRGAIRRTATLAGVRASHGWLFAGAALLLIMAVMSLFGVSFWTYRWNMAIGWIVGLGWITNAVAGYLHRILPFLFWHHRYWGVKKEDVKTRFPEMVDQKLGRIGVWIYNAGVGGGLVGLWYGFLLVPAIILIGIGLWLLVFNLVRAYFK